LFWFGRYQQCGGTSHPGDGHWRKVWGGNRTWEGAHTQQILVSVLRTCWQQGKDAFTRCVGLLRAPRAVILDIVPGAD
jgi:hypothetical protein